MYRPFKTLVLAISLILSQGVFAQSLITEKLENAISTINTDGESTVVKLFTDLDNSGLTTEEFENFIQDEYGPRSLKQVKDYLSNSTVENFDVQEFIALNLDSGSNFKGKICVGKHSILEVNVFGSYLGAIVFAFASYSVQKDYSKMKSTGKVETQYTDSNDLKSNMDAAKRDRTILAAISLTIGATGLYAQTRCY